LFAWNLTGNIQDPQIEPITQQVAKIDKLISKVAPKWPVDQINKVELAILRYSLYELLHQPNTPPKVVIDEAIEIAKEFGDNSSPAFINAVLGKILKTHVSLSASKKN
jgi:N utilization substance protein B